MGVRNNDVCDVRSDSCCSESSSISSTVLNPTPLSVSIELAEMASLESGLDESIFWCDHDSETDLNTNRRDSHGHV